MNKTSNNGGLLLLLQCLQVAGWARDSKDLKKAASMVKQLRALLGLDDKTQEQIQEIVGNVKWQMSHELDPKFSEDDLDVCVTAVNAAIKNLPPSDQTTSLLEFLGL
jgi:hypothetical protein